MEPAAPETTPILATRARASLEDWLAIPETRRAELIDGVIVYQALPGPVHGSAQGRSFALVDGAFGRRTGTVDRPGGWWISQEVDMDLGGMGCRPDVLGWRRDTHPRLPRPNKRGLVTAVPDWVCEILSHSTAYVDLGKKREGYHRAGVGHYWLVDPVHRTLTVLERTERDYLIVLVAGQSEIVRAAPFDTVEMSVAAMFDEDDGGEPETE